MTTATFSRVLERLVQAVLEDDLTAFRREFVIGAELLGLATATELLEQQLPEALSPEDNRRLAFFMLDGEEDSLESYATDLVAENVTLLQQAGLRQGQDFKVLVEGADPTLQLSLGAALKAQQLLSVSAWRALCPWVLVVAA
jgi:hypothetical protein